MRKLGLALAATWSIALSGCGCIQSVGESTGIRYPDPLYPDPNQSTLDRCLFGRKHGIGPGDRNWEWREADATQPGWHELLFGRRYVPKKLPESSLRDR
jgi:hypothetical protein